ncbi:MAG: 2-oxo acid dehydrogenase subunit E2 [Gammaproteobacteria bacterium]|nr:MAG: 2-oxo acid dehydrogenase subunit E2 [Gammaproteobacteria bacterium]
MSKFKLPDLGEGLAEAEISAWFVSIGDHVVVDQPLVAMETDKAVVDVPSPQAGQISGLFGDVGDIIATGAVLVEFAGDSELGASAEAGKNEDSGTVVGDIEVGDKTVKEEAIQVKAGGARLKATPAVRALARKHDIDLSVVTPSGANGTITKSDIERVAALLKQVGPLEKLTGPRRSMALNMAQAGGEVVPATVFDDADISDWHDRTEPMLRLLRAMVVACQAEPALNAWYDSHAVGRRLLAQVDIGVAVDSEQGLFVPVLRNAQTLDAAQLKNSLAELIELTRNRTIAPAELRGSTITLSNFGSIGGRYASPVVLPPTVAIVGAGRSRDEVVARDGQPAVRHILPLSLCFDHRAVTGGEATRFMTAMIADLKQQV